jgi:hypothetical protein
LTNFISFSLYGSDQKYVNGAIKNAEMAREIYPGWQTIFYVDSSIDEDALNELELLGGKIVFRELSSGAQGVFWRFDAARLPDAETVIFRDSDSRLSVRESSAVQEWLESKSELHAMRDHPFHSSWILAGMWGARGGILKKIAKELPTSIPVDQKWGHDQRWLAVNVYKPFHENIFMHDSFFRREHSFFFPKARDNGEYVGEVIDANGCYSVKLREIVKLAEESSIYSSKLIVRDWFRTKFEQSL